MARGIQLQTRTFQGQNNRPHVLITGGVHGDEFESMAAIRRLIRRFETEEGRNGLRGTVTLVPVVNEPAFLCGQRTAEDGLDLARVCPGRPAGSITERIAHLLSELIRKADYFIDLHTGGTELAILPLVGYMLHPDPEILEKQRRMARAFNLPIVWGTSPDKYGRTLSVARDAGVPAIYAEYHGSATCDQGGVEAYEEGCLNVMAELGMIDRPPTQAQVRHVVEDGRPESGHLQVCNPSPMTGFFQASVKLGDRIAVGEPIGTVCDVMGETVQTIFSEQNGIVLVLRTFPRVREGETVGVVLELAE